VPRPASLPAVMAHDTERMSPAASNAIFRGTLRIPVRQTGSAYPALNKAGRRSREGKVSHACRGDPTQLLSALYSDEPSFPRPPNQLLSDLKYLDHGRVGPFLESTKGA
jgi:hypothetical protein